MSTSNVPYGATVHRNYIVQISMATMIGCLIGKAFVSIFTSLDQSVLYITAAVFALLSARYRYEKGMNNFWAGLLVSLAALAFFIYLWVGWVLSIIAICLNLYFETKRYYINPRWNVLWVVVPMVLVVVAVSLISGKLP